MEAFSSSAAAPLEQSVYSCEGIVEPPTKGRWESGCIHKTRKARGTPLSAMGSFQATTERTVNLFADVMSASILTAS